MQKELDEFLYENSLYLTQNFKDKLLPWLSQIYNEGYDNGAEDNSDTSYDEGYRDGVANALEDFKNYIERYSK